MRKKLALFGGVPIVKKHSRLRIDWPIVDKDDFLAVKKVFLEKDFSGRDSSRIKELEKIFSEYYENMYATAFNSGTSALHAALVSLGVGPGDEVIVPAFTFISTALGVIHNQSIPIFADVDKNTYNICPDSIKKKISKKTKALIVVHLNGFPADMDRILKIAKKHKIKIIEDVAQAPGAIYKGKKVGTFGDASFFSLMSQKNIATCGEAGILLNKNMKEKNKAEMVKLYGKIFDKKEKISNAFTLGWNYILNPIQASMAITQFKKSSRIKKEIQQKARYFNKKILENFPWIIPPIETEGIESVFHFYRIRLNSEYFGYKNNGRFRKAVQDALNAEGLSVRYYLNIPTPGQLFFQQKNLEKKPPWIFSNKIFKYSIYDYPNTLDIIKNTLVLGAISSAPGYLLCDGTIEKYLEGFKKIERNIDLLIKYADELEYREPWKENIVISDSFMSKYKIFK